MARETADRESPNIPNRPKSVHSTTAMNEPRIRIRHPEYHQMRADAEVDNSTVQFLAGQDPEEGTVSLDTPCEPFADTACYPLDLFERSFTGGTYSAGDAWGAATGHFLATDSYDEVVDSKTYTYEPSPLIGTYRIASSLGTRAIGHTTNPGYGCTGLDFTFTGWFEVSNWYEFTVPSHPANAAGITFGPFQFVASYGLAGGSVGQAEGATVMVSHTEPGSARDGTVIGILPHLETKTLFIPVSLLPAAGEKLYLGFGPNWQADLGSHTCGFRWPWQDGQGNSARVGLIIANDDITWQIWDATADDWGAGVDGDANGAFFDGSLPWTVSTTGGTPGINGSSLYLTAAAGLTQTLVATMAGLDGFSPDDDDDGYYGEPWTSEFGTRMKARFRLTTAGSLTEAGSRYLKFKWHDGKQPVSVTVRLGDVEYAQGLVVEDEANSEFLAKDVVEGAWMWVSLDLRNPYYLRGKMWQEGGAFGSGEPPIYDLQVGIDDDSESPSQANYFEITMSVGNQTGADQTIEVDGVWFCNGADDCMWVSERLGQGDGYQTKYATSMAHKEGSLWFFIDGFHVRTVADDLAQGTFYTVDYEAAAENAVLVARYRVDLNPDGD